MADAQPMQTQFRVVIDYNALMGTISVSGPLSNRMLMLGMLELAKDSVREQYEKEKALKERGGLTLPPAATA